MTEPAYTRQHMAAFKAGHCLNPVLPTGLSLEGKRRYLVGWLVDLKKRNRAAWERATTIEIVRGDIVIAAFRCQRGKVDFVP